MEQRAERSNPYEKKIYTVKVKETRRHETGSTEGGGDMRQKEKK
jgi:hypothetical protein